MSATELLGTVGTEWIKYDGTFEAFGESITINYVNIVAVPQRLYLGWTSTNTGNVSSFGDLQMTDVGSTVEGNAEILGFPGVVLYFTWKGGNHPLVCNVINTGTPISGTFRSYRSDSSAVVAEQLYQSSQSGGGGQSGGASNIGIEFDILTLNGSGSLFASQDGIKSSSDIRMNTSLTTLSQIPDNSLITADMVSSEIQSLVSLINTYSGNVSNVLGVLGTINNTTTNNVVTIGTIPGLITTLSASIQALQFTLNPVQYTGSSLFVSDNSTNVNILNII